MAWSASDTTSGMVPPTQFAGAPEEDEQVAQPHSPETKS